MEYDDHDESALSSLLKYLSIYYLSTFKTHILGSLEVTSNLFRKLPSTVHTKYVNHLWLLRDQIFKFILLSKDKVTRKYSFFSLLGKRGMHFNAKQYQMPLFVSGFCFMLLEIIYKYMPTCFLQNIFHQGSVN